MSCRCLVAQMGARRHYAIPRVLHSAGMLACLHTDICATQGWPRWVATAVPRWLRPASVRRMLDRKPIGIPPELIQTHDWVGILNHARRRRATTPQRTAYIDYLCRSDFATSVAARGLGDANVVYAFDGAGLELLRRARQEGIPGILDQCIAARASVIEIVDREQQEFPGVGTYSIRDPGNRIADREKEEWEVADVVLCGSEFVKETIRAVGGPVDRVVVVPSGVDLSSVAPLKNRPPERPLRVLFVGEVGLRKGAHYLIEAARELRSTGVSCRLVGTVQFRDSYTRSLPDNVTLCGTVPRSEIAEHYRWADLFCFPSLCEGSALVTYEAMSMGLPVVTTPSAGSIIRDGVDGYLIPARSTPAIVEAIERFAREGLPERPLDPEPYYSLQSYQRRLLPVVEQLLERTPAEGVLHQPLQT